MLEKLIHTWKKRGVPVLYREEDSKGTGLNTEHHGMGGQPVSSVRNQLLY